MWPTPATGLMALLVLAVSGINAGEAQAQLGAQPKLVPPAVRLFDRQQYVRQQPAPDFWALLPYYVHQEDDFSCSAAAAAMVLNGLRVHRSSSSTEPLATPRSVVSSLNSDEWKDKLSPQGAGVTLDELAAILPRAGRRFGLANLDAKALRAEGAPASQLAWLREQLRQNECSDRDFLIANVLQSELTGDAQGAVGHFAPVAAYDAAADRVLLLDPDRQWYEPYWVTSAQLLQSILTLDPVSGKTRGLLKVEQKPITVDR